MITFSENSQLQLTTTDESLSTHTALGTGQDKLSLSPTPKFALSVPSEAQIGDSTLSYNEAVKNGKK